MSLSSKVVLLYDKNSPKIYDLRTPQKKSRKSDMYSDDTSEKLFDLSKDNKQMQSKKIKDSIPAKPISVKSYTSSRKLVSLASENTAVALVDMILLEESSPDKHSKTGTVMKLKDCKYTWLRLFIFEDK